MQIKDYNVLAKEDVINLIKDSWMLVTAGKKNSFNTMTASWGGVGCLWNKPVAFVFVRPERFTHQFIEAEEHLTLSFFKEEYRHALQVCGTKSGRDSDKVTEAGLTPKELENGAMTFAEARMTLVCRKLYAQDMTEESFKDRHLLDFWYRNKAHGGGLHTVYVVEIEGVVSEA